MHSYHLIEKGQPLNKATKAMILLHGRGGRAEDILKLAPEICDDSFYLVAPQATNNSWYPNKFMDEEAKNEPWLSSATTIIQKVIDETAKVIPKQNIYILGFSQGACLALEVTARNATKYGGIFALSGGLIGPNINPSKYRGNYESTTIFLGVSEHDPFIPLTRVLETKPILEKLHADLDLRIYKGSDHTVTPDEISSIKDKMKQR